MAYRVADPPGPGRSKHKVRFEAEEASSGYTVMNIQK